ncbi:MAG: hypothetical protein F6K45_26255 [Kamptonema sp. SIO1D9]|nr:hypothetical protein [Kamptonema sp. SIO1D9]
MNKVDYWFLDTAIGIPISFDWIIPYEEYEIYDLARTPFDLTTKQIVEVMDRLFQDELILAITHQDLHSLNIPLIENLLTKGFRPSFVEIEAELERKENLFGFDLSPKIEQDLYYFLTPKGGELWESVSHPKWEQYFHRGHPIESLPKHYFRESNDNTTNCVLWCTNREIGTKFVEIEEFLEAPASEYNFSCINNSQIWEKITPWHPTYWKTLSSGYVVTYQVQRTKIEGNIESSQENKELVEKREQAKLWYRTITKWYTSYYQRNEYL